MESQIIQTSTQESVQAPVQIPDFEPKPNYLKIIIFSVLILMTLGLITYLFSQNQKLQKQIINQRVSPTIQAPSPTPKEVSSISIPPDETAGWKTYKNDDGYSIKYPNDWIAKSSTPGPGEIELISNSRGFTSYPKKYIGTTTLFPRISIDSLDPKMETILGINDYYSWVNYLKKNQFFLVEKETKSTIGGIETTILEGSFESSGISTYHKNYLTHTSNGDKYISIQIDDFADKKQITILDQILSTFKFL